MRAIGVGIVACFFLIWANLTNAGSSHTNNWAVLVSTSRFWFNYRHMANVLSMYRTVRRLGIPDSQIILMLSDDVACNSRNLFPGAIFNNADRAIDLYGQSVEVDYRGYEVTVENFVRLLTDRWDDVQPKSKRLLTDENSNIFIYMTGHGGEDFLKFQDAEEISSYDLANAFAQMHEKKRYNEIFFMIDTCQANTMYSRFYSPNVLAVGSSELDESSYSHHSDVEIGVAVIDRFTYYTLEFMEQIQKNSTLTLQNLFDYYTFDKVHSHVGVRKDLYTKDPADVLITDFFGNIQNIILDDSEIDGETPAGLTESGRTRNLLEFAKAKFFANVDAETNGTHKNVIPSYPVVNEDLLSGETNASTNKMIKLWGIIIFLALTSLMMKYANTENISGSRALYSFS
ncbi:ADR299Wp [Eremothecium gossypii ATCC 10895]|uniref:ADR299Wp n=1 Tax=Eremothecium gossypii (strain ATCC 10895 / CBS 109.51 / FGSC 9923 / NRRL Y-1056) TaxID=284811 RepID=Q759H9_EREGS|nr:ADR299Wp [Eremothecium gossypii ATCC 10895]AAS52220.1 ADR299Wp [Eremothecium gossypii ATCC 10895]AEY96519.1 FADR299Wp [Eremothecium gossypii FDAG1]